MKKLTVSAIIPAFNEAENIALVVAGLLAQRTPSDQPLIEEVIVADNSSTDDTALLAQRAGAKVVSVAQRGYGSACAAAGDVARGEVFLYVDGDHTADLSESVSLIAAIERGADVAIGARAHAAKGSMTVPQRLGNALACWLIRMIWRTPISDLGPFRAVRRSAYARIAMQDRAYGWTVEMQVRAAQLRLAVVEVPVKWFPRHAGHSKVSGTVRGVFGAGVGILSIIARLWWRERATRARTARAARTVSSKAASAALPMKREQTAHSD